MTLRTILSSALAVLALGVATVSQAAPISDDANETVLLNGPVMVQKTINYNVATPLTITGAGQLSVTVTDENFPAFASLQFALADANGALVPLAGSGTTETLDLTQPSTIYVDIFATTQSGYGLYTIDASFDGVGSPVPLPPSALLLAAGLLFMAMKLRPTVDPFGRVHPQAAVTTSVA